MNRKKVYSPTPFHVYLVGLLLAGAFSVCIYAMFSALVRSDPTPEGEPIPESEMAQIVQSRNIEFTQEDLYRIHLDIPESEYAAARMVASNPADTAQQPPSWYPKGEAPVLHAMVEAGDLPPVAERVGPEPVVIEGVDGIGRYGGTWLRVATAERDVVVVAHRLSGATFTRFSPLGEPVVPHLMKRIDVLEDSRVYVLHFRRGIRWSDGHPVDAGDLVFWWEHEIHSKELGGVVPPFMRTDQEAATVTRIDDFTVRIEFAVPNPEFMEVMALESRNMLAPEHYRRQFHPELGDPSFIQPLVKSMGLSSPKALYQEVQHFLNPQHPRLWPWVPAAFRNIAPYVFVRNPYYYVVDPAGNQLPYIDRLQFDVQGRREMIGVAAAGGKLSMQARHLTFSQYTELMSRRKASGTRVRLWVPEGATDFAISLNQNRRIDPGDPDTARKAALLSEKRFRQALSLAINRPPIIQAYLNNLTQPVQAGPGPESPYYSQALRNAFVEYDPDRGKALLDELWRSLGGDPADRDDEGYRLFPDGSRMTFYLTFSPFTGIGPMQFVVDDWADLGVRVVLRERDRVLFFLERNSRDFDMCVWGGGSRTDIGSIVPTSGSTFFAPGWGSWYEKGGLEGSERCRVPSAIPVPEGHPMREAMTLYSAYRYEPSHTRRQELAARIAEIGAENLWTIGLSSAAPQPVIADADMRNIPELAIYGFTQCSPANTGIETYFFGNPVDSPAIRETIQSALRDPPPIPMLAGKASEHGAARWLTTTLKTGFLLAGGLLLLLLAVRHPFVGRRLLLMVPTLIIISVCVFTIIQLPPGDFLTSRIIQLEEAGEDPVVAEQEIAHLKEMFHYDEPVWKRYLYWTGVFWFASFEEADKGLLQGNMGRSMQTTKSVNDMIGDRLLLTFCISLGTILFTWAVALPIGIYSAVRQHSITDYAITIVGFLGMCVPPFLLALILMTLANVSGLFSPEYMTEPGWTWGKVVDLLKHIWVPIVVMGVGGTAAMIRVMRANLLDELRKPYVITARAKGMRPIRLLFKYPVRIALNPFISGIGGLFPQLISGGTIVAMVLTLPTVGPLMLSAIFSQDMNMAGSMLMLLSLLGVVGTLVSDLLLLWVDPRIRMEGGQK